MSGRDYYGRRYREDWFAGLRRSMRAHPAMSRRAHLKAVPDSALPDWAVHDRRAMDEGCDLVHCDRCAPKEER